MPRHRKDSPPRHRAQRRDNRPGRGAADSAGRERGGPSVRGLLVTPWFAAGVGILVAATVALEAPKHAVLSYGPIDPGVRCKNLGCASASPTHAPGALASAKPGIELPPPAAPASTPSRTQPARAQPAPSTPAASVTPPAPATPAPRPPQITLHFGVLKQGDGNFLSVITVHSTQSLGNWSLGFTIPGARISDVWGADWRPSASPDSGVANGQPWPWPRPGPGMAKIVIFATGTPAPPVGCIFDGESCAFS